MEKIRILFLSANPWTTSRILVDEEAREIFESIQEGPHRDKFELHNHSATRPIDLQRLLLLHQPHIVHFSGHGSKRKRIILGGTSGKGRTVDRKGLVEVFALYSNHVQLVLLNACFTNTQARSVSEVINYSIGTGKGIGDKAGVAFAGAFYRALGFGKSVKDAFASANAELALIKMPRSSGIELFVRDGITEEDPFPLNDTDLEHEPNDREIPGLPTLVWRRIEERSETQITIFEAFGSKQFSSEVNSKVGTQARFAQETTSRPTCWNCVQVPAAPHTLNKGDRKMPVNNNVQQQLIGRDSRGSRKAASSSSRKSGRKAPGTRYGTLEDWREGSNKSGKVSGRHHPAFRDGR